MKLKQKITMVGIVVLSNTLMLGMISHENGLMHKEIQHVEQQIKDINGVTDSTKVDINYLCEQTQLLKDEISALKLQPTCDKCANDEGSVELKPVEKQPVARTAPQPIQEKEKPKENTSYKEVNVRVSFYTSLASENGGYEGMNAISGKLKLGSISAPKSVPFGSKISIAEMQNHLGITEFTVDDRGGAIFIRDDGTYKLDVYVPKKQGESDNEYFKRVNSMGIVNTKAKIYFK